MNKNHKYDPFSYPPPSASITSDQALEIMRAAFEESKVIHPSDSIIKEMIRLNNLTISLAELGRFIAGYIIYNRPTWRLLGEDEIVWSGDQSRVRQKKNETTEDWEECKDYVGYPAREFPALEFRTTRPLSSY